MTLAAPAASPARALEFWFEIASTYSYPTAMRIEALARERGVQLRWRSFWLGPIFFKQGWQDSPFNIYPAKGRYMWRDLERVCSSHGLEFSKPSTFPRNGLPAARIACRFRDAPWIGDFVRAVYRKNFVADEDVADPRVLRRCLEEAGQDPKLVSVLKDPAVKEELRAQTEEAGARGIFGAPSFLVGDELFWGNDRLEQALDFAQNPLP